jgi:hypothetical protein
MKRIMLSNTQNTLIHKNYAARRKKPVWLFINFNKERMKHLQKVVYCLDTEGFTFKPKPKHAAISSRIANNPKASTIEELAKYHVTEGRAINCSNI